MVGKHRQGGALSTVACPYVTEGTLLGRSGGRALASSLDSALCNWPGLLAEMWSSFSPRASVSLSGSKLRTCQQCAHMYERWPQEVTGGWSQVPAQPGLLLCPHLQHTPRSHSRAQPRATATTTDHAAPCPHRTCLQPADRERSRLAARTPLLALWFPQLT